jgi:pimeloyl-ACP methyl ester carboxylesterase
MSTPSGPERRRLIDFEGSQPAIEIVECGDPAGRPVMFFHGWPSAASQSLVFDEAARADGVRLVAANRPGIGRSAGDPLHSIVRWATRVAAVSDALGLGRFGALGVSGGGPYALAAACLLGSRIDACAVVSCTPPIGRDGGGLPAWLRAELTIRRRSPATAVVLLSAARLLARRRALVWMVFTRWAARGSRETTAIGQGTAAEAAFRAFREAIESPAPAVIADADPFTAPWGFRPAEIAAPVCFWHGRLDRTVPWAPVDHLVRAIPRARVVLGEDDGHHSMSMLRTNEILSWLTSASAGPGSHLALTHVARVAPDWGQTVRTAMTQDVTPRHGAASRERGHA